MPNIWNSIKITFVKKTSMPNPFKSFGILNAMAGAAPEKP